MTLLVKRVACNYAVELLLSGLTASRSFLSIQFAAPLWEPKPLGGKGYGFLRALMLGHALVAVSYHQLPKSIGVLH